MTADAGTLNPRLQEIAEEFGAVAGRDRLQLLLEFSEDLPPLPARYAEHRDLLEPVPECQSPLFLAVEVDDDAVVHLFFDAPRGGAHHPGLRRHPARRPGRAGRGRGPGARRGSSPASSGCRTW